MWPERATAFLVTALALATPAVGQIPDDVKAITSGLVCTCGCGNMIVANCNCSAADQVRGEVAALLASGLSRPAVFEEFARRYGSEVLAAPPARGFGLAAWTLPFAALAGAGWFLGRRLRRWAAASPPTPPPEAPADADRYSEALEREIGEA